jgi:hypothetical protein
MAIGAQGRNPRPSASHSVRTSSASWSATLKRFWTGGDADQLTGSAQLVDGYL